MPSGWKKNDHLQSLRFRAFQTLYQSAFQIPRNSDDLSDMLVTNVGSSCLISEHCYFRKSMTEVGGTVFRLELLFFIRQKFKMIENSAKNETEDCKTVSLAYFGSRREEDGENCGILQIYCIFYHLNNGAFVAFEKSRIVNDSSGGHAFRRYDHNWNRIYKIYIVLSFSFKDTKIQFPFPETEIATWPEIESLETSVFFSYHS